MENDQMTQTNSEVTEVSEVETTSQDNVSTEEPIQEAEWEKIKSEEDYRKLLQSTSSKAKKEIMEELKHSGFTSLDDVKKMKFSYDELSKSFDSLSNNKKESDDKIISMENEITGLKEKLVLKDLNIADEYQEDFLKFSRALVTENIKFEDAAKEIASKYQMFKVAAPSPSFQNISVEKSSKVNEPDALAKKYSWLQD